ncbi:hypothetical protein BGZ49_000589, partial [Haplosporangium sp. Z 27]
SNKSKSASAASTPSQTPPTSIQGTRTYKVKAMNYQLALEIAMGQPVQIIPSLNNIM